MSDCHLRVIVFCDKNETLFHWLLVASSIYIRQIAAICFWFIYRCYGLSIKRCYGLCIDMEPFNFQAQHCSFCVSVFIFQHNVFNTAFNVTHTILIFS